ncbi:MAG: 4-alpha-glucanotransferase, partial [Puniceicoccales bacterium]|nr:4-alpha-glucanotransferase [Puniceicoccales bacterium]
MKIFTKVNNFAKFLKFIVFHPKRIKNMTMAIWSWLNERGCGIFLHISSLPNGHGIGCFCKPAYDFIKFLAASGMKYWQLCPLNPTSYGDSPYQSPSAF